MYLGTPITITDAIITASSIAETDHAAWLVGTTYAALDRVIMTATHKIYESVTGGNLGNSPDTDDGSNWIEVSATEKWKPFDRVLNIQATSASAITYTFEIPSGTVVDSVALFNMDASSVGITIDNLVSDEIYDTGTLILADNEGIADAWSYCFNPISTLPYYLFSDLPAFGGYDLHLTISNGASPVSVGQIVLCRTRKIGTALDSTEIGFIDFSTIERDDFGRPSIVLRPFIDRVNFQMAMETDTAGVVRRLITSRRGVPNVYFAGKDIQSFGTLIYGIHGQLDIPLEARISRASLEVQGLT